MQKRRIVIAVQVVLFISLGILYADSPITSTPFYTAYNDIGMVRRAETSGVLTLSIAHFFSSTTSPIDVKAAVINALSWDIEGKNNAEIFFEFLEDIYKEDIDSVTLEPLSVDEIFCLGYLMAMDDYFYVYGALDVLYTAWDLNDTSFTISIILAIVEAQDVMDFDWCEVWLLTEGVLFDKTLKKDMRDEAIEIIVDYMKLYEEYCEEDN
jgi:hypothetical protein